MIDAAKRTSDPGNINTLLREWCEWSFPLPLPDESIATFKQALLGGLPEYEWTVEWNAYMADETNEMTRNAVVSKLRVMLKVMLNMAEYHVS